MSIMRMMPQLVGEPQMVVVEPLAVRETIAADMIGMDVCTLRNMRCAGGGPEFTKPGGKMVIYLVEDIKKWLQSQKIFASTSDSGHMRTGTEN